MPIVRISWFAGRDAATKQALAAEITESIAKHTGSDPKNTFILFEDVNPSDWAAAGKLFEDPSEGSEEKN